MLQLVVVSLVQLVVVVVSSLPPSRRSDRVIRCVLAMAVIATAALLAPEDPKVQATICLRHHSPEACRVW